MGAKSHAVRRTSTCLYFSASLTKNLARYSFIIKWTDFQLYILISAIYSAVIFLIYKIQSLMFHYFSVCKEVLAEMCIVTPGDISFSLTDCHSTSRQFTIIRPHKHASSNQIGTNQYS